MTFQHEESTLPIREKITDTSDIATEIETVARDQALQEARRRAAPQQSPRADGTYAVTDCEECGNEIGEARLRVAAMNKFCVDCASAMEKRQKR